MFVYLLNYNRTVVRVRVSKAADKSANVNVMNDGCLMVVWIVMAARLLRQLCTKYN